MGKTLLHSLRNKKYSLYVIPLKKQSIKCYKADHKDKFWSAEGDMQMELRGDGIYLRSGKSWEYRIWEYSQWAL